MRYIIVAGNRFLDQKHSFGIQLGLASFTHKRAIAEKKVNDQNRQPFTATLLDALWMHGIFSFLDLDDLGHMSFTSRKGSLLVSNYLSNEEYFRLIIANILLTDKFTKAKNVRRQFSLVLNKELESRFAQEEKKQKRFKWRVYATIFSTITIMSPAVFFISKGIQAHQLAAHKAAEQDRYIDQLQATCAPPISSDRYSPTRLEDITDCIKDKFSSCSSFEFFNSCNMTVCLNTFAEYCAIDSSLSFQEKHGWYIIAAAFLMAAFVVMLILIGNCFNFITKSAYETRLKEERFATLPNAAIKNDIITVLPDQKENFQLLSNREVLNLLTRQHDKLNKSIQRLMPLEKVRKLVTFFAEKNQKIKHHIVCIRSEATEDQRRPLLLSL